MRAHFWKKISSATWPTLVILQTVFSFAPCMRHHFPERIFYWWAFLYIQLCACSQSNKKSSDLSRFVKRPKNICLQRPKAVLQTRLKVGGNYKLISLHDVKIQSQSHDLKWLLYCQLMQIKLLSLSDGLSLLLLGSSSNQPLPQHPGQTDRW